MSGEHTDFDPDEIRKVPDPESAFREAEGFEWRGEPLRGFSFLRQTAAVSLGLQYGNLTPEDIRKVPNPLFAKRKEAEEEAERIERRLKSRKCRDRQIAERTAGELRELASKLQDQPQFLESYDGLIEDAVIVVWLCLQKDSICARARRLRDEYKEEIARWADAQGITINSQAGADVCHLFEEIISNLNKSRAEPNIPDDGKGADSKN